MTKIRKGRNGLSFENKIDLSRWEFNAIEGEMDDAFRQFEEALEEVIEKEQEKLRNKIQTTEDRIKRIASEALEISFEREMTCGFYEVEDHPEKLTIYLSDFAEDGYYLSLDIREAIKDLLLEHCSEKDGYIQSESEAKSLLNFAKMLDEMSHEIKTAVRQEN